MQRRLLSGNYDCSLDNRYRLAVPARLRDRFADGVVIAWWLDPCLVLVPRLEWGPLVQRTFGEMSVLDDDQRELSRFLLAGAFDQELDKQGRVLLPPELREHAGIDAQAKVVGAGDYLEVWNPDQLATRFAELRKEGVSQRAKRLASRMA
ncbi:MAG: cell division/cell wall cluster transcriptional repressor MraZ [Thermoleophilia bacterium]|nr:cell division/cell wall cluster transcriptional repressor MraZ [Thermoleophilia bacterium]MDH3724703.1 cell division/cell wall cluster transcriptional repressor MraZ [Thermoleophilia bacterium]